MPSYIIRDANKDDIDFIVEAIIEAEKSGSEVFSYSRVFNLSEEELKGIFRSMLLEEVDGCEFSISNYIIAETGNVVVGTIGAYVESNEQSSSIIKSNLLRHFLPARSIIYASQFAKITSELVIDHVKDALSLVVVYINPAHRGNGLFELLTEEHIKRSRSIIELSVQVMANNLYAIRSYERYGFRTDFIIKSDNENIRQFLPYNEKILMKKSLK
jgi:ribosomal protein S18 acetylase RimI-like enzyme